MSVQHCPHCGLNAWIKADRVCPSCHIHLDAPVTAEDQARIVRIQKRPGPRPMVVAGASLSTGVLVCLVYKVIMTFLSAAMSVAGH